MFKILILFLAFSVPALALNLAQVRADLKKSSIPVDSVEMNVRTTISVAGAKQSVSGLPAQVLTDCKIVSTFAHHLEVSRVPIPLGI